MIGHDAGNVPEGDDVELVVSTAIGAANPERAAARERGLREIHRGELLGELSRLRRTIAIAGTHGKTTTASMATHALLRIGWEPSYVIGGALRTTGANAGWGAGEWLVVEADESDRSFLRLAAEVAVVTNIELDHHTTYASHIELEQAFAEFLGNGLRVVVADAAESEAFLDRVGIVDAAFFGASDIVLHESGSRFAWAGQEVALSVPGAHNVGQRGRRADRVRHRRREPGAARRHAARLRGRGPALRAPRPQRGRRARRRRLRPSPDRGARRDPRGPHARRPARGRRVPAAPLLAHATAGARVRRRARARRRRLRARDLPVARARRGLPRRRAACSSPRRPPTPRGGKPVAWAPDFEAAERLLGATLREGDVCLVLGAGDIDALGRRSRAEPASAAFARPIPSWGAVVTPIWDRWATPSCGRRTPARARGPRRRPRARRPRSPARGRRARTVVPAPRFVRARVCFDEIAMPSSRSCPRRKPARSMSHAAEVLT